jgi:hypothetical protein
MTNKTETLSPMQQELLNRADAIFSAMADAASKASSFVAEQVPEIALQYVAFGRAWLTTLVVISILCVIVSAILFRWLAKNGLDDSPLPFSVFFGMCVSFVLGLVLILNNLKDFLLVWFAPKVWLITSIAQLVSSK